MVIKMEEKKENKEDIEEQEKCWICKRGFAEALEEFNNKILTNIHVDDRLKSRYEKGKNEFFPSTTDKNVEFLLADVKDNIYSMSGKSVGDIIIKLCPVCSGLLESLSSDIDIDDFVTKKDLEDTCISIRQ